MFKISLRIHLAAFPIAGWTINAPKKGKRVVVSVAEVHKKSRLSLNVEIVQLLQVWCNVMSNPDGAAIHNTDEALSGT